MAPTLFKPVLEVLYVADNGPYRSVRVEFSLEGETNFVISGEGITDGELFAIANAEGDNSVGGWNRQEINWL